MPAERMETVAVSYNDLIREAKIRKGVTLASGTNYTAGMLVVSTDGVTYSKADIALSTAAGYNTQTVGVVLEAVDGTSAAVAGVIAMECVVNRAKVTFNGTQTEAALGGVLQAKNITLEDWSK